MQTSVNRQPQLHPPFIFRPYPSPVAHPIMLQPLRTAIPHVPDIAAAKDWYRTATGIAPHVDAPFYVGFDLGETELDLAPAPEARGTGQGGATACWRVRRVDDARVHLLSIGGVAVGAPRDVGGEIRVASARDPFGNVIGVIAIPGEGGTPSVDGVSHP
jgi:catechol 2,3-dioxygenase-like lactoylglutathione lyase family enzyme